MPFGNAGRHLSITFRDRGMIPFKHNFLDKCLGRLAPTHTSFPAPT